MMTSAKKRVEKQLMPVIHADWICLCFYDMDIWRAQSQYTCLCIKSRWEKIPRAFACEDDTTHLDGTRCRTLFVGKGVQSEAVSEQLEIEKDSLSEEVQKKKKRKRGLMQVLVFIDVSSLRGDERDFGVVSDGDIASYMSPGPSYTSHGPLHTSPASTAHKSLQLDDTAQITCSDKLLKDTHLDDSDAAKDTTKDTHLDDVTTISVPDAPLREQGMLDGLHINAFIEVMMRKKRGAPPFFCNAQWTLGHSELVAFYKDSSNLMSMVSVVDAVRATIDGTNPRYPSWEKISQVFFPINLDNQHWVAASWNLDDYQLFVYDSLECPENYEKIINLLKKWKDFIQKDLESMDWFKKTKRDPECFRILLRYVNDMPRQSSIVCVQEIVVSWHSLRQLKNTAGPDNDFTLDVRREIKLCDGPTDTVQARADMSHL
ncbi:phospholipase-like protein [Tanacetum coccineum]